MKPHDTNTQTQYHYSITSILTRSSHLLDVWKSLIFIIFIFGFKSHNWCGYGYSSTPYSQKSFRNDIQIYRRHSFKFLAFWIVSLRLHGFKDFVFIFDPNRQSIYRNGMIYSSLKFWWSVITFYSLPPPPTPPSLIYIEQVRNEFPITLIHVFFS